MAVKLLKEMDVKKLEDCNIGDFVILWCHGLRCWDDDTVKVISKGILVTVQNRDGSNRRYAGSVECKMACF